MAKKKAKAKPKAIHHLPIAGQNFTVEYTSNIDSQDYGEMLCLEKKIRINTAKNPDTWESTLFHEALHGALETSGLDEILKDNIDEAIVKAIENALWPVLKFREEFYE